MSTDDFETRLRARLADLADREDDWDDPTPTAREIAAAGIAPDDDPAILTPVPPARERRRWLPGLAVAAVLLAVVVGGGLGIRELARGGSNSSAGSSAGFAAEADSAGSADSADSAGTAAPNPAASGTSTVAAAGPEAGSAGCDVLGAATSTGPLAAAASIRPSGITGPRATAGGSAGISYQLTFAEAGGSAQLRPALAVRVSLGQLCGSTGTARSGVVQAVPVEPGAGVGGSATFAAVDSTGSALPAGEYLVVVVIPYSVGGSGMSQLVSAPVTVTVTS